VGSTKDAIEMELLKACKEAKGKDERLVRRIVLEYINYAEFGDILG